METELLARTDVTFTVEFAPSAVGYVTGTVSIASTDLDDDPYVFDVLGYGITPVMEVLGLGTVQPLATLDPAVQLALDATGGQSNDTAMFLLRWDALHDGRSCPVSDQRHNPFPGNQQSSGRSHALPLLSCRQRR